MFDISSCQAECDPFTFNDQRQLIEIVKEDFLFVLVKRFLFSGTCVRIAKRFFYHTLVCMLKRKKSGRRCNRMRKKEHMIFVLVCFYLTAMRIKLNFFFAPLVKTANGSDR